MSFQPFYEGMKFDLEVLYRSTPKPDAHAHYVALLEATTAIHPSSTIIEVLKHECLNAEGYRRSQWRPDESGIDLANQIVKFPTQNLAFEIAFDQVPLQFNAMVLLSGARARANAEIAAIQGSPAEFTTTTPHEGMAGDRVFFTGGMPANLEPERFYYLGSAFDSSFYLSETPTGNPIQVGTSWSGILRMHYANGVLKGWQFRDDDGTGNRMKTLNPGQTHTVPVSIGLKAG